MKRYNNHKFQDIVGQGKIVELLSQAINKDQVSHSYIFSGPKGSQRTKTAYSLAKSLFCKEEDSPSSITCKRVDENNHPDLINIYPDGASIKIKQIRELRKDISIKPYESNFKIYIIHEAQTMGIPAQNALLKTLEEPPDYGVIILINNNLQGLLPTIISRSQILKFQVLTKSIIEEYLVDNKGLEIDKAKEIAAMADGSLERAISLINEDTIQEERQELLQSLLRIIKGDIFVIFSTALWLKERKEQVEEWLNFLIIWFRDVTLLQELGDNQWILHKGYMDLLGEFSYYLSQEQIHAIIEEVNATKNNIKFNVNLQLSLEAMLLKIQEENYD